MIPLNVHSKYCSKWVKNVKKRPGNQVIRIGMAQLVPNPGLNRVKQQLNQEIEMAMDQFSFEVALRYVIPRDVSRIFSGGGRIFFQGGHLIPQC